MTKLGRQASDSPNYVINTLARIQPTQNQYERSIDIGSHFCTSNRILSTRTHGYRIYSVADHNGSTSGSRRQGLCHGVADRNRGIGTEHSKAAESADHIGLVLLVQMEHNGTTR